MNRYLEKILDFKQEEVQELEKRRDQLIDESKQILKKSKFKEKLRSHGLSLIAEIKKASPSKGIINSLFDPLKLAENFLKNNAKALSVLTEKSAFLGNPSYIELIKKHYEVEILRKDFIINELQIYESKLLGASAILLIKAILKDSTLKKFIHVAESLDLDILVEVHNIDELKAVLKIKKEIMIGINNRNLKTFEVDIENALNLAKEAKKHDFKGVLVAESGYQTLNELLTIEKAGFDAVLIGEGLIKKKELLKAF